MLQPSLNSGYAATLSDWPMAHPWAWRDVSFAAVASLGPTGVLHDMSARRNDGVFTNTSFEGTESRLALRFSSAYVTVPKQSWLGGGSQLTLAAWISPDTCGDANFGRILDCTTYSIYMRSGGGLTFIVASGGHTAGAGTVTLGRMQHVVARYNGSVAEILINGQSKGSSVVTGAVASPVHNLVIGDRPALDRSFDGLMDDWRIYSRWLENAEVQELYRIGPGGSYAVADTSVGVTIAAGNRRRRLLLGAA